MNLLLFMSYDYTFKFKPKEVGKDIIEKWTRVPQPSPNPSSKLQTFMTFVT